MQQQLNPLQNYPRLPSISQIHPEFFAESMNIHSGGQVPPSYGGPPPGAPGAPPGHPHYPGEPNVYPPPPPGVHVMHHPHHGGHPQHPHHMGDDSMDGGMDHDDSDANVNDDGMLNMGGPMVGVMGHPEGGMEPPKRKRRRQALSCTGKSSAAYRYHTYSLTFQSVSGERSNVIA